VAAGPKGAVAAPSHALGYNERHVRRGPGDGPTRLQRVAAVTAEVVIGVDAGTSGTKALAVTADGTVVAEGRAVTPLQPAAIVAGVRAATAEAVAAAQRPVAGLALCGAMHSLIGLDAQGEPLTPLLTWEDDRAAAQAQRLREPALVRRTGTPMHPMSPLAKLCWWRETEPETFAAVRCWAGMKELVLHALTGELLTDHGTASGTGLRNLRTGRWDEEALAIAGIDEDRLPRLVDGTHVAALATAELGLPAGTPVVVGGADGPLANVGLGAIGLGAVACSIGTSGAVRVAVDVPWVDPGGRTFCYVVAPGRWVAGGATNGGGVVLDWLREAVAPDLATPAAVLDGAAGAPPGSDGLLFLPHLLGERAPQWRSGARGAYLGLHRRHGRAHLLRSAIEGTCLQLAVVLGTLGGSGPLGEVRATGGFARSPLWRAILAAAIDRPVGFAATAEGSALGASLLGMTALGLVDGLDRAAGLIAVTDVEEPDPRAAEIYARMLPAFAAAQDAVAPIGQALGDADRPA
jgi:gluconokinase